MPPMGPADGSGSAASSSSLNAPPPKRKPAKNDGGLLGCLCWGGVPGAADGYDSDEDDGRRPGIDYQGEAPAWDMPPIAIDERERQSRIEMLKEDPVIKKKFLELDLDGSGNVSIDELEEILTRSFTALSREELRELTLGVDKNGDGNIDLNELCTFLIEQKADIQESQDECYMLDLAFSAQVWGKQVGAEGAHGADAAVLTVDELKKVFTRTMPPDAGLSKGEFADLLEQLGLAGAPPTATVTLSQLRALPHFAYPKPGRPTRRAKFVGAPAPSASS